MKTVKKILIGLGIFIVLVWAFFFFAFDPLLKRGIIIAIQSCTGARAEIASLKTKFLHPMLEIRGLAAASASDEFKNYVEFEKLKFDVEGMPLLKKKFIADEASLTGLRFGTPRKTSGRMPEGTNKLKKLNKAASDYVENMKNETKSYTLERKEQLKADFTVNPEELETVRLARSLEEEYKKIYASISSGISEEKYKAQIEEMKALYASARQENNFLKQAKAYSDVAKKAKEIKSSFEADKQSVKDAMANAKASMKKLDQAKKNDLKNLTAQMKLPSFDAESIAKMVAGPAMSDKVELAFGMIETAKKYMKADGETKEEPEAAEEKPAVKDNSGLPSFVIKKMQLSGEFGQKSPLAFDGTVNNFTTEPGVWGKPIKAKVNGSQGKKSLDFNSAVRVAGGQFLTDSVFSFKGADISAFRFGSENSLLVSVADSLGDFSGKLKTEGAKLNGNADLSLSGTTFTPSSEKLEGTVRSVVESTFRTMKNAKVGVKISGEYPAPSLGLTTDIASQLSKGLQKAAGDEVKKATEKAKAKLEEAVKPYTDKLLGITSENEGQINAALASLQSMITNETAAVSKK